MGQDYPKPFSLDQLALVMVHPGRGYLYWHIEESTFKQGQHFIRVSDINDIEYDGANAHTFFDLPCHSSSGGQYFDTHHRSRTLIAEIGLQENACFVPLIQSRPFFFDRDHSVGDFNPVAMLIDQGKGLNLNIPNLFESDLIRQYAECYKPGLKCKVTHIIPSQLTKNKPDSELSWQAIRQYFEKYKCECDVLPLSAEVEMNPSVHVLHAHDWDAAAVVLKEAQEKNISYVLSLHTNLNEELECSEEQVSILKHSFIISVVYEKCKEILLEKLPCLEGKIIVVPGLGEDCKQERRPKVNILQSYGLNPEDPILMFAGEIAHSAGADILIDALFEVFKENQQLQVIMVGDGPLRSELEGQMWHAGFAHRVRFTGHLMAEAFESLLEQIDFMVVPARSGQDELAAKQAVSKGKPVLITHQSQIRCIEHGVNGFITYDNPGSMVWGIKELVNNEWIGGKLQQMQSMNCFEFSPEGVALNYVLQYMKALTQNDKGVKSP